MATEESGKLDQNIPQWKRDLILRRRAVGRVLPTGSGSVQLTCPSVVAAVRFAEYSVDSDFLRRCESERDWTGGCKNMRLVEQVAASDDFVEPCVIVDIKEIITKIESVSSRGSKMGEEKNPKKMNSSPLICEKKSENDDNDDDASDSSEEFKYGPGIVSKLKSKYLSLTLRESQGRIRPTLDSLRRATSLENILDSPASEKVGEYKSNYLKNIHPTVNGNSNQRCRGVSRVNKDSMKRARSVEVLTRYDRVNVVPHRRSLDEELKNKQDETEGKRKIKSRINSFSVEETELPPPDLVKHTLKIFESSHSPNIPSNLKIKNQKNASDYNCAKKPLICPKPQILKQNSVTKTVKSDIFSSASDICNKNKFSDSKLKNLGNSTDKIIPGSDVICTVEKPKAALLKDKSDIVINKKSSVHLESLVHNEETDGNNKTPDPQSKDGLSFDMKDSVIINSIRQKTSLVNSTTPKTNNERLCESPEPIRCISPVLVRAPPCILSSELNSSSLPTQQIKQIGIIRPIVTNKSVHSNSTKLQGNKTHLTEREIEKNLINKVKSIEQPVTKVIVSLKKSPEECLVGNETNKENDSLKKGQFWNEKSNTMVFNFSNRKTVPDYIENDGLSLAPRKEKQKLEPGIILLGGGTEDSSADYDDSYELFSEPPLPCDIIFEGDNILINGKSNIQSKPKLRKMKIQFNDEATTLFEYPSEASLLEDQENLKPDHEVPSITTTNSPGLPNPFLSGCSNLASYTPSKVSLSTDFQLGVTKTTPPPPAPKKDKQETEEEEEQGYLRPADESNTVSWSAETAADLLF